MHPKLSSGSFSVYRTIHFYRSNSLHANNSLIITNSNNVSILNCSQLPGFWLRFRFGKTVQMSLLGMMKHFLLLLGESLKNSWYFFDWQPCLGMSQDPQGFFWDPKKVGSSAQFVNFIISGQTRSFLIWICWLIIGRCCVSLSSLPCCIKKRYGIVCVS